MRKAFAFLWFLCVPAWGANIPGTGTVYVDFTAGTDNATCGATAEAGACKTLNYIFNSRTWDSMSGVVTISVTGTTNDATAVIIPAKTGNSATNYISVVVAAGSRHAGVWSDTKWNSTIAQSTNLTIRANYARIDGLQLKHSSVTGNNKLVNIDTVAAGGSDIRLSNIIGWNAGGSSYSNVAVLVNDVDATVTIYNCIFYDLGTKNAGGNSSIYALNSTAVTVYNSTLVGHRGITRTVGTVTAVNVYAARVDSFGAGYSGTMTLTTCASSDTSGSEGLQSIAYDTSNFTNVTAGSENLLVPLGSALIDVGTDNPGSGLYSTDIKGSNRATVWDVGADECDGCTGGGEPPPTGTSYYVRTDGSDLNTGLADNSGAAWLTIGKCASTLAAGDTCHVAAGTYAEVVQCTTTDGTAGNPITFLASGTVTVYGWNITKQYYTINGFTITGIGASYGSVYISRTATGAQILNNNIVHDASVTSVQGIDIDGGTAGAELAEQLPRNIVISGNTINEPSSTALTLHGKTITVTNNTFIGTKGWDALRLLSSDTTVSGNTFGPWGNYTGNPNHCDMFQGFSDNGEIAINNVIEGNTFTDGYLCQFGNLSNRTLYGTGETAHWTFRNNVVANSGYVTTTFSDDIKFYNNTFYISGQNSSHPLNFSTSMASTTVDPSTDIFTRSTGVSNNLSSGGRVYFTNVGGALPDPLVAGTRYFARDVSANTFKVSATWGGSVLDITTAGTGTTYADERGVANDCVVENNIFYQCGSDPTSPTRGWYSVSTVSNGISNFTGNYNLVYGSGAGTTKSTFTNGGREANGVNGSDPTFVSATNYHLQVGSPAIGAGDVLNASFTADKDGTVRGAAWDQGAYEYGSDTPDTTNPSVTITGPTSDATYDLIGLSINLSGTSSDNVGVTNITYSVDVGGTGNAVGTTTWSITGLDLAPGANVITITAHDAAGNVGTDVLTVDADPGGDITPPVITVVSATGTLTGATVTWTTDENSDSQVQYWLEGDLVSKVSQSATLTQSHSRTITGLSAGTAYLFRVLSRDAAGNLATGSDNTFGTAAISRFRLRR